MTEEKLNHFATLSNLDYYGARLVQDGDILYLVFAEEACYYENNGAGWTYCGAACGMTSPEIVKEAYEILKKSRSVT